MNWTLNILGLIEETNEREKRSQRARFLHSVNCHVIMQNCSLMFSARHNI